MPSQNLSGSSLGGLARSFFETAAGRPELTLAGVGQGHQGPATSSFLVGALAQLFVE